MRKHHKKVKCKVPANRQKQEKTAQAQPAKKIPREREPAPTVPRDQSGRFLSSGNPNGRPTAAVEVRDLARQHGPEAIERLVIWMRSADPQSSIMAAKILLERGFGKAIQPLTGTPNGAPLVSLTIGAAPVASAEEAARVYAELCRDPSLDVSGLKFASRSREPALIEQGPNTKDIADEK
jgi:pyruvate/2-oxoglutarate dehydrogenase complex dihydrolipoamide acyltransferase (E2) component